MKLVILLTVLRALGQKHLDEAKRVTTALYEESIAAQPTAIDPLLMTAISEVESGFKMRATNWDGSCVGLTQPRVGVSTNLTAKELLNPSNNVREGARILNEKLSQCGTLPRALAAYNNGSCVPKGKAAPRVRRFVRDVLRAYEHLQMELRFRDRTHRVI